ncbi:GPW/gp25 family protein [Nguyenibacter vanlangensis]|uniref:GPW/gp25 family protein n=1 Tax=Nguyenibacter vanlangensis TaxID=1216886 RepID=A0ABZ3D223_9PROT
MIGVDRNTGKELGDFAHLAQSVGDILTTPIGSRVMRRTYGSQLLELVDSCMNQSGVMDIYAATVQALIEWEPRIQVMGVQVTPGVGSMTISVSGNYLPNGTPIKIDGIVIS